VVLVSEIVAASAVVTTIKNVLDLLRGAHAGKVEVFEKVIKPMHAEAEAVVTDYYKFFHFIEQKVGKYVESPSLISLDDFQQIEAAYSDGKAQRDGLRALAKVILDKGKPRLLINYCASIDRIFHPLIDVGSGHPSAARRLIDLTEIFSQSSVPALSHRNYTTIVQKQIRLTEERWVAACQIYASICLRAYRR
jgi:hypothetical protein